MKSLLLACVLAMVWSAAHAQSLSDYEADVAWIKLEIMTSGETEAERFDRFKSRGISDESVRALVAHVERGQAEMHRLSASFTGLICDDQEGLRAGGQEGFAQLVERFNSTESDARRKLVEQARELLPEDDKLRFDLAMSDGRGLKVGLSPTHVEAEIRTGRITVDSAIASTCKAAPEQRP